MYADLNARGDKMHAEQMILTGKTFPMCMGNFSTNLQENLCVNPWENFCAKLRDPTRTKRRRNNF